MINGKTIADMHRGETGVIKSFGNEQIASKLLEMGCLPDSEITLVRFAPFGCPLYIKVKGHALAIRKSEAAQIILT